MQHRRITFFLFVFVLNLLSASGAWASDCEDWVAKVVSMQGGAQSRSAKQTSWLKTSSKETFCIGDIVQVGPNSRMILVYRDNSQITFDQNTVFRFIESDQEGSFWLDLQKGIAYFISRLEQKLNIRTPFMNAGVSGTEFQIAVSPSEAIVTVFEGQVKVENARGSLSVDQGQSAQATADSAPLFRLQVTPRDAVAWTLYYPTIIQFQKKDFESDSASTWHRKVAQSISFNQEGRQHEALAVISDLPDAITDARFFNYRASLRLSVGRILEAESDIGLALQSQSQNADALALKSIIATVQNKQNEAQEFSQKAIESAPESASAHLAQSYALQANFRLREALKKIETAVQIIPENALLWSRLAELRLMFREIDRAQEAAERAVRLNKKSPHALTVLGFSQLMQYQTDLAKNTFEAALALNSNLPLARLGLGLTLIRSGHLSTGRAEIEIAVMLDPAHALLRSYMGKAYFEEKRDDLAETQYQMARERDPQDPTPELYSAILNQSLNRPLEALNNIRQSTSLNGNRLVYRSRLLLDEDLAVRSGSLARIYENLGFQELALLEGWQSVTQNPSNAAAHRFLADSYAVLPRSEISRVSEVLIAQLLQPINSNPVQPRLGIGASSFLAQTGPSEPSFNEFSPLFNRNRVRGLSSVVWGENGLFGEEIILSGLQGQTAFSFGQFNQRSDGFRNNNDIKINAHNAFIQSQLSTKTSVQLEYRFEKRDKGDRTLRFDPSIFSDTQREKEETKSYRLGFRHALTPRTDILVSYVRQDREVDFNKSSSTGEFTLDADAKGDFGEIQYLFRSENVNLIWGGGLLREQGQDLTEVIVRPPGPIPPIKTTELDDTDRRYGNYYLYSFFKTLFNTTLILGGSKDRFRGVPGNKDLFSPKAGLIWKASLETTVRVAAFRVMKRPLLSNQTIEPTQVAGFSQFFDDAESTVSKVYGLALDHRWSSGAFTGLSVSTRDRDIPIVQRNPSAPSEVSAREELFRIYVYKTLWSGFSLNARYEFEQFERSGTNNLEVDFFAKIVKTQRVPIEIRFFSSNGFFAELKGTSIRQKGEFLDRDSRVLVSSKTHFWIGDLALGYRFPKRRGILRIGAKNLFDRKFRYHETDILNPSIEPERVVFTRLTFSF